MEAAPVQKASQPDASELSLPVPSRTRCLSGLDVDVAALAPAWLRYARAVARSLGARCGEGGDFIWSEVKARSRDFLGSDSSDRVGQKVVTARRGGGRTFSPASPSLPFILVWSRLIDVFLESPKVAAF